MTAVIVIIAFVALFTLLDYSIFQRWQMSTSSVRTEMVFEKRNQEYGAYQLRKQYDQNLVKIMLFLALALSLMFGIQYFFKGKESNLFSVSNQINETVVLANPQPKNPEIPVQKNEIPKKNSGQQSNQFIEPIIQNQTVVQTAITHLDSSNVAVGNGNPSGPVDPFGTGQSQNGTQTGTSTGTISTKPPTDFVDVEAQFPGGYAQMIHFIQANLVYPQQGIEMGAQGKCFVKFVIDENGTISSVKVVRGVPNCPECDQEAIKVVKSMPEWIPGKIKGEAVSSFFMLPIIFSLE